MRLPGYDYSQPGWYFVTICTKNRREVFGSINNNLMNENVFASAVRQCWFDLPNHYFCELDAFVIMPNHIHGIIVIPESLPLSNTAGGGLNPRLREGETCLAEKGRQPSPTVAGGLNPQLRVVGNNVRVYPLTEIVRGFKTFSAAACNRVNGTPGGRVWQTSFHEHVLRGNDDILMVREYIRLNPQKWDEDRNNFRKKDISMVH